MNLSDLDLDIDDDRTTAFDRAELGALRFRPITVPPAPRRAAPIPPPLPTSLRKRIAFSDAEWLASLPKASRAVLIDAAKPALAWPQAARIGRRGRDADRVTDRYLARAEPARKHRRTR